MPNRVVLGWYLKCYVGGVEVVGVAFDVRVSVQGH